jgi:hypothetical protein
MIKMPGAFLPATGVTSSIEKMNKRRPCATFVYSGETMQREQAALLLSGGEGQKKLPHAAA